MARLVVLNGAEAGTSFMLGPESVIGRQSGLEIRLNGNNVSRRHARLVQEGENFRIEDLCSSNGTFVNGVRLESPALLKDRDEVRVGPFVLRFELSEEATALTIRAHTAAHSSNADLFRENSAHKLQIILQLSTDLGRTLDPDRLLPEVLGHLFALFPQAEIGYVVLIENGKPVVRAHRHREEGKKTPRFSNSLVHKVITEGMGLVADDVQNDPRFQGLQSICSLGVHSLMCVPLLGKTGKVFGALQLERHGPRHGFTPEDLHFLTAIGLQVSVALENAQLHQEALARQRLERDLVLAREIQSSYLPSSTPNLPDRSFDLHGELFPAHEISGDFYDYFKFGDDRLALAIGDVTGKGMPAALFMSMVQVLLRSIATPGKTAGGILRDLNNAVAAENPKCLFVTLAFCIYDPAAGMVDAAFGGHPPGLLRRAEGTVEIAPVPQGPLIGFEKMEAPFPSGRFQLQPRDLFLLYTDGVTEAPGGPGANEMFGLQRLSKCLAAEGAAARLPDSAEQIRKAAASFSGQAQEDDVTLVLLRRHAAAAAAG